MAKLAVVTRKSGPAKPQGSGWLIYKRLAKYVRPFLGIFLVAVFANIIFSAIDSTFAYLLKPLLNKGFIKPDPTFLKWIPLIIVGLFTLRSGMNMVGSYCMSLVTRSVVMGLRRNIFDQFLRLPCSFYDHHSSGELLSILVYNAAQISSATTNAVITLVQSGALVIGLLVVMFSISWQLSTVFLCTIPVIALLVKLSSTRMRRLSKNAQEAMGSITHVTEETLEGYKVVRTFGGENYEAQKFYKATDGQIHWELKLVIIGALSDSSVQLIGVSALATMIYMATNHIGVNHMSAGGFTAVVASMMALLKPMRNLTSVNSIIQRGLAGAESIFALLDEPTEKDEGTTSLSRAEGLIEYRNVNFQYEKSDRKVLHNISFKVPAGKCYAIVGRSGSGKSTLVSLLPRFYDIQEGELLIDGINVFDLKLADLRRQFASVSQNVVLFNDTIAANIAYGSHDKILSREEIIAVAKAAHAMEFIEKLPNGIDTRIGENGVLLSGGQRQRIAIARAILKNAPILILDEATSALDTESERYIQAALDEVMKNRTTVVIAHRLSTIENADCIIVMDQGYIVEMGTHAELMAKHGYYCRLHSMHFADVDAAPAASELTADLL
ncbi:MAG: lipid A export permease/ATP-binding protein MsbA [Gammaproteobacteria bacterium]|nr:lipid A export permease/ATP-binding protein MsbA [Gammaproteobacteria bacterium]